MSQNRLRRCATLRELAKTARASGINLRSACFDGVAHLRTVWIVNEVAERVVPEFVSGAMLVQNPEHLVWVRNQVGGKAQTDKPVDARARNFGNVEQAAGQNVIENLFGRVPLERNREDLRFVSRLDTTHRADLRREFLHRRE